MKQLFAVTGMNCAVCKQHVEEAVRALPGIEQADVSLLQNRLVVVYDEQVIRAAQIIHAIEKAGYGATLLEKETKFTGAFDEAAQLKKRFWLSVIFLFPLFLISMVHTWHVPAGWQLLFTLPILWINRAFFVNGFMQLFKFTPTMDSLVALGATAALGQSIGALCGENEELYFESAAMIVTLVTLGKWLEARAKSKTTGAISGLVKLLPAQARIRYEGKERQITVNEISAGDVLLIRAGERISADGNVIDGHGTVDESVLTGESLPQDKQENSFVRAGSILTSGYIEVQVQRAGGDTVLAQMILLVEQAANSKAPVARLTDQVSRIFVPVVIVIALITCLVWLISGATISFALSCAICVLVISCPCALGLATPTAIMVGMGVGAKRGILIKSAEVLERTEKVQAIILDKTGTVTSGHMQVAQVYSAVGVSEQELLTEAISLEKLSSHPLAIALLKYNVHKNFQLKEVRNLREFPGFGLRAEQDNNIISGGNLRAMQAWHIQVPNAEKIMLQASAQGQTILFFARGEKYLGAIGFSDTLKSTSKQAVSLLKQQGCQVALVTGDNERTARYVAEQLNIEQVKAEALPTDKRNFIKSLQEKGTKVAMVGDGINDAPSLACADVGIALGSGTDIAAASADLVLMRPDLREVATALQLSHATLRNIKENLFWAFFYNTICIPVAAGVFYPLWGWKLHPMLAAAAMSISSLCVVTNALRLNRFKPSFLKNQEEQVMHKVLEIQGMMCGHCAGHVARALNAIPGVKATVDLTHKTATVESATLIEDQVLIEAVKNAGYEVTAIH